MRRWLLLGAALAVAAGVGVKVNRSTALAAVASRHAALGPLPGRTALCVGCTAGIGSGIAARLAQADVSVTVVGRNAQAGAEVVRRLQSLSSPSGGARHRFVQCDAQLIANAPMLAAEWAAHDSKLDYLVLSQGIATIQGRTETSEGLDQKLALHYFSRMALIRELLPFMRGATEPRVLSVLSGGVHSAYNDFEKDFELKDNYSLMNAANSAGFYNDLGLDAYAVAHPEVSFVHAAPGGVASNWGTELPAYLKYPVRVLQMFMRSVDDCGEYMYSGLVDREHAANGRVRIMGQGGEVKSTLPQHTAAARQFVWSSTQAIIDRVYDNVAAKQRAATAAKAAPGAAATPLPSTPASVT